MPPKPKNFEPTPLMPPTPKSDQCNQQTHKVMLTMPTMPFSRLPSQTVF